MSNNLGDLEPRRMVSYRLKSILRSATIALVQSVNRLPWGVKPMISQPISAANHINRPLRFRARASVRFPVAWRFLRRSLSPVEKP